MVRLPLQAKRVVQGLKNEMKSAAAAVDLWEQLLERAKSHEWSTFMDPEYEPTADRKRSEEALAGAGWSETEIRDIQLIYEGRLASAPSTSAGVAPHSELFLERTKRVVLAGLLKADRETAKTAHFAVEPKAGPFVSTVNVPMTDETVITMGTHFTRYCGLIAKAFLRTHWKTLGANATDFQPEFVRLSLRQNPDLLLYWWQIFTSFAVTGTNMLVPFRPCSKLETLEMEQVALAMEVFGLAHEVGHHCQRHGRQLVDSADAITEEFAADYFAAMACERAERTYEFFRAQRHDATNPYLWTGAGGILLLGSLEIYRKIKNKIYAGSSFDTHPDFAERAHRIRQLNILEPGVYWTRQEFCSCVENILSCVLLELEPLMDEWVFEKYRAALPSDWEAESFRSKASFSG